MPGIYGFYSRNKDYKAVNAYELFYNYQSPSIINQEFDYQDFTFGRSVLNRFLDDRFIYENEELIITFEGVCYSQRKGKLVNFIVSEFDKAGLQFLNKIKGLFSGFVFCKKRNELFIFNDHLSTKPIYYYKSDDFFVFASEVKVISKLLRQNNVVLQENVDAWRCLLTFGYFIDDLTPVQNVYKLRYGSYIHIKLNTLDDKVINYYEFPAILTDNSCNQDFIERAKYKIDTAVRLEWNKDSEYDYDHFSYLSGGLDSRLNVLLAAELGYNHIRTLTFSESGSLDDTIAALIAKKYDFKHTFIPLDNGSYLQENLEQYVKANDGMVVLHGAAHLQYSINKIDLNNIGLGHSGQIGDVIFGSYFSEKNIHDNLRKACYNPDLEIIRKIEIYNVLKDRSFDGDSTELFLYKNRAVNGILNGDRVAQSYFDTSSPFYDTDVVALGFCLPKELKRNARFYRQLISDRYPFLSQFKWQQTGIKPRKGLSNEALSFLVRLKRFSQRKMGLISDNMNPFEYWYTNNYLVAFNIEKTFSDNLHYIDKTDIRNDVVKTFKSQLVSKKLAAITVLLSKKLHFSN